MFFAHRATPAQQASAGFVTPFEWDVDLLGGYDHVFLDNVAGDPGSHHFGGCDTPDVGKHLAEGHFDALLVMGWHLKSYWQAIWAAKTLGLRVMVRGDSQLDTPRGLPKRLAKGAVYPFLLRVFDAALFVGERNRAYYAHYHYPQSRLFASPHCVDTARFAQQATPDARFALRRALRVNENEKLILFAGKLVEFKRPLDVVAAAAALRGEGMNVHLMVAGSGPLQDEVRTRSLAASLPAHLLGFQNQTQIPAAYAASDVLVLPSTGRETWGLVANEALASGTPIVVSDAVGCAPDLAADGKVGRTFAMGDVNALAKALAATLNNPPTPDRIRRVSDRFSLSVAVDGVEAALRGMCTG
ncbi:glycosyltransferase involved in cell wall biosynthesis [Rhodoblastus acidophilus]|uniref:glycosyltransferase family 4 protein n=1 Tax=Rhodoblastus acidophilus TaxID=1074 RepID=UPI0022241649|nr:glycosyltransferase family 4 protein [Rhodoblastus acidophilus]MCW2284287.1 glycosyltransferase involved in cell wall biosynthesis [Rhodoblastus acidophilus]MCW2333235.1 glycosyltransferase involved in cell wall biosynthesis [Rhodoblastus acidophilus]